MTAVILQARLDSSRLPEKSLLPLGNSVLLFQVMSSLKKVPCDLHILACPEDCIKIFSVLAEKCAFNIIGGSKEDVLNRYCNAIRYFKVDRLIRATGDNPFVFIDAAEEINNEAVSLKADYAGYSALPYGAGVESVSSEALLKAEREATLQSEREHVCPYLYNHGEKFLLHRPLSPLKWRGADLRITVDTREDYERAKILHNYLEKTERKHCGENIIGAYRKLFV